MEETPTRPRVALALRPAASREAQQTPRSTVADDVHQITQVAVAALLSPHHTAARVRSLRKRRAELPILRPRQAQALMAAPPCFALSQPVDGPLQREARKHLRKPIILFGGFRRCLVKCFPVRPLRRAAFGASLLWRSPRLRRFARPLSMQIGIRMQQQPASSRVLGGLASSWGRSGSATISTRSPAQVLPGTQRQFIVVGRNCFGLRRRWRRSGPGLSERSLVLAKQILHLHLLAGEVLRMAGLRFSVGASTHPGAT
eukprot:scaffold40_cov305-Pinguiococcus_pyrenoidosus.AAC.34